MPVAFPPPGRLSYCQWHRGTVAGDSGAPRLSVFRALTDNKTLIRVVAAYALFVLTEYSVWIAMLVFAYSRGGATVAGLVALAQLVPAAVLAPVFATLADRRSPVALLAGGYLAQATAMGATAIAVAADIADAMLAADAAAAGSGSQGQATEPG